MKHFFFLAALFLAQIATAPAWAAMPVVDTSSLCSPSVDLKAKTWQPMKPVQPGAKTCEPHGPAKPMQKVPCQWGNVKGFQWVFHDETGRLIQATSCAPETTK